MHAALFTITLFLSYVLLLYAAVVTTSEFYNVALFFVLFPGLYIMIVVIKRFGCTFVKKDRCR